MRPPSTPEAALLLALAAGAVLGAALAAQHWGGVVPCALCLVERWPWRAAILLGLAGMVLPRRLARLALGLGVLALLAGAGLGAVHVGVEQGAWPSPLPECAAPPLRGATLAERLAAMPDRPAKPCDAPTYLVPSLPVSMAAMNLGASLAVGGLLAIYLARTRRSTR
ncbi:MAG TPA: disulfide bond formation protein B [Acetobacteraceae bacterium]|nr:disulfide bond formation protein B [Acetobacteraceae bacterium]